MGIVRVIEAEREEGGYLYFVMEYVAGGDLRQAVLTGRLPQAERLRILLEVGDALEFAHQRGVIHRDVKPANILLDHAGRPKLTDFDLVRALDTTGGTRTEGMLGTFLYAAPEAMQNPKGAAATADVYSLGMTAVFAVYGKELPVVVMRNVESIIDHLECSPQVKKVLAKAVDWDLGRRIGSVAALCRELNESDLSAATEEISPMEEIAEVLKARRAEQIRVVFNALNSENRDCPRLFTLVPFDSKRWDPRRWGQVEYHLTLWCEHPQHQHPCKEIAYRVPVTREWLTTIAPYASLVAKILKVTVPLIAPVAGLVDAATQEDLIPQLALMEKLTAALSGEAGLARELPEHSDALTVAEGAGLRELRWLLLELDPRRTWGGLRRVLTPSGDYLWVCPEHYREYDPGLPDLSSR